MSTLMFGEAAFDQLLERFPARNEATEKIFFEAWRERAVSAGNAVRAVMARRDELRAGGALTAKGIAEEVAKLADKDLRRHLDALEESLAAMEAARGRLRERAGKIPSPDPADAEGAIVRSDVRRHLLSLEIHERIKIAMESSDDTITQAIEGAPAFLTGIPPEVRSRMVEARVERNLTPLERAQLQAIDEAAEVSGAVAAGLRTAMGELARQASAPTPPVRLVG